MLMKTPVVGHKKKVSGAVVGMDFTADGRFLMLNSSGMDMIVVNAETCKKASPKDMKALRYYSHNLPTRRSAEAAGGEAAGGGGGNSCS